MHVWGWRTVLGLVLASLLAAGTTTAAPVTTLVVITANPILETPMYVGVARDIFTKHGLTVRLVPTLPGVGVLQGVVDGAAQVGVAVPHQLALARAQGANLKSIFAMYGDATGRVPPDALFVVIARRTARR
jgi:ABC-type nitrate/sulfonate/bicarbonate transport system substrate-binding protein